MQNQQLENANYSEPLIKQLNELPENVPNAQIAPTPNNPPWNAWTATGIWAVSLLTLVIFQLIFVIVYILISGVKISPESLQSDPNVIFWSLVAVLPAQILTLAAAWAVVTRFNKFSFKETLGWNWGGFKWWYFPAIIIAFFVLAAVVTTFLPEQENELTRILKSSRAAVYVTAILATFGAPVVEEVVYRGVLYSAFQRTIGVAWAVVLVTTLFAGVHFVQYWGSPGTIVLICVLSLILTMIRVKTGNILPCIVLHFIFNGIQSLLLLLQPFLPESFGGGVAPEQTSAIIHLFNSLF